MTAPTRPRSITLICFAHAILGVYSVIASCLSIAMGLVNGWFTSSMKENIAAGADLAPEAMTKMATATAMLANRANQLAIVLGGVWLVVGLAMIIIGQGLWALRPWSRASGLTLAWIMLPLTVLQIIVGYASLSQGTAIVLTFIAAFWAATIATLHGSAITSTFARVAERERTRWEVPRPASA